MSQCTVNSFDLMLRLQYTTQLTVQGLSSNGESKWYWGQAMMPCISVEGTIQEVKAKDYSTGLAYLYTSREHSLPESHQHVFTMRLP